MARIHFVCKRGCNVSPRDSKNGIYDSGNWDISLDDARRLIGGYLYLHERKQERSYFGGIVQAVEAVRIDGVAHVDRVRFVIQSTTNGKDVKWDGHAHARAWTSGVLE